MLLPYLSSQMKTHRNYQYAVSDQFSLLSCEAPGRTERINVRPLYSVPLCTGLRPQRLAHLATPGMTSSPPARVRARAPLSACAERELAARVALPRRRPRHAGT